MMLIAYLTLIALSRGTFALPCATHNSAFRAANQLTNEIAVIGPDDRDDRHLSDTTTNIEAAQGRIWCVDTFKAKPGQVPTREQLKGNFVANATLAFDDDMAIVSRHMFIKANGKPNHSLSDCFFEHIASGSISPIKDVEYNRLISTTDKVAHSHQDFAVIKLNKKMQNGSAIKDEDILIDWDPDLDEKLTVVSNFAANNKSGRSDLALTITRCLRYAVGRLANKSATSVFATDCDTGGGSSAAQAYLFRNNAFKIIGIVTGEVKKAPEGGRFNPSTLSTGVVQFDRSIFELAEKIRGRSVQGSP